MDLKTPGVATIPKGDDSGDIVGMAIVLDDQHVVTCAHVVNAALGRNFEDPSRPAKRSRISIAFPFAPKAKSKSGWVCCWHPMGPEPISDIAVLEFEDGVPESAGKARLTQSLDIKDHEIEVYGIRGQGGGNHVDGKLKGLIRNGTVQFDGTNATGIFIEPGFSGAAVWDKKLNAVVGMVSAKNLKRRERVAYMIPISVLKEAWPALPDSESVRRNRSARPGGMSRANSPRAGRPTEDAGETTLVAEEKLRLKASEAEIRKCLEALMRDPGVGEPILSRLARALGMELSKRDQGRLEQRLIQHIVTNRNISIFPKLVRFLGALWGEDGGRKAKHIGMIIDAILHLHFPEACARAAQLGKRQQVLVIEDTVGTMLGAEIVMAGLEGRTASFTVPADSKDPRGRSVTELHPPALDEPGRDAVGMLKDLIKQKALDLGRPALSEHSSRADGTRESLATTLASWLRGEKDLKDQLPYFAFKPLGTPSDRESFKRVLNEVIKLAPNLVIFELSSNGPNLSNEYYVLPSLIDRFAYEAKEQGS
jgi:hypothetical protein